MSDDIAADYYENLDQCPHCFRPADRRCQGQGKPCGAMVCGEHIEQCRECEEWFCPDCLHASEDARLCGPCLQEKAKLQTQEEVRKP